MKANVYPCRWIIQEEIPYFRAIKHIPMEMRERLPAAYARALDSNVCKAASLATTVLISIDDLET